MKNFLIVFFLMFSIPTWSRSPEKAQVSGTATTVSTLVLPYDTYGNRQCLSIQNKGGVTIFAAYATQTSDEGVHIPAGTTYSWECGNAPRNAIYLKASSGGQAYVLDYDL